MQTIQLVDLQKICFGSKLFDYRHRTKVNNTMKIPLRNVSTTNCIDKIVFHCTDAPSWSPDRLSSFFVDEKEFPICSYHYYVMKEYIYHMVGENVITYHAAPWNSKSVSFSIDYFATEFEKMKVAPDMDIMQNAINTATYLCFKFRITNIVGHRELQNTGWFFDKQDHKVLRKTCPGLMINLDEFRSDVIRQIQRLANVNFNATLAEDGIAGPATNNFLSQIFFS
jgi:hypothetical protein